MNWALFYHLIDSSFHNKLNLRTPSNQRTMAASLGKYVSKLAGTRVLVIGGSSGIGFGVAEALVQNGASSVIISSSSAGKISHAIERLQSGNTSTKAQIQGFPCDLGSPDTLTSEVEKLFAQVAKGGKLDAGPLKHW